MKKFSLVVVFCIGIIVLGLSCQKENKPAGPVTEPGNANFSVKEARTWFGKVYQGANNRSAELPENTFAPAWEKPVFSEDENNYVIECPVKFDKGRGFVRKIDDKPETSINGQTHLLILKNKRSGKTEAVLMNLYSYSGITDPSLSYKKINQDYNGLVLFSDLDGKIINGWEYSNGKVSGKCRLAGNSSGLTNRAPLPEDCTNYIIDTYERTCYGLENGDAYCTDWEYVGSTTVVICGAVGGGDGGYQSPTPEELVNTFKANYEVSLAGYSEASPFIYDDAMEERTKSYTWVCAEAPLLKIKSLEYGVQKKVNGEWRWKSLEHKRLYKSGTVLGGTVNLAGESAIITLGLYYALVHLDFEVHYSVVFPNSSPFSWDDDFHVDHPINVND